jgi:hypothetical protein
MQDFRKEIWGAEPLEYCSFYGRKTLKIIIKE